MELVVQEERMEVAEAQMEVLLVGVGVGELAADQKHYAPLAWL